MKGSRSIFNSSGIKTALLLIVVAVLASPFLVESRVIHNTVAEGSGLHFLAKFCFSKGVGNVYFQSWHKSGDLNDVLLLGFDDETSSWPDVYDGDLSCEQIRAKAKWFWPVGDSQIEHISTDDHVIPRYWYLALSRCTPGDYEIEYKLEFLQGGGFWENQFSYDSWALMGLYLGLWIFYFILLGVQLRAVIYKVRKGELNHLQRIFSLIIIVYEIAFLSFFIHNAIYADDGVGAPGLEGFGEIMDICGEILFMGLALAMARGWLVTTTELRGKKMLIAFFCVFLVTYIAFFIWENVGVDLETNSNVYESVPGIINLCVRVIIWIFFAFYIGSSLIYKDSGAEYFYQHGAIESKWEPEQRRTIFFFVFGGLISIWFLVLPFFVLISLSASNYDRVKMIEYIYYMTTAGIHALLAGWFFFKSNGPVDGGDSLLGGIVTNERVDTASSLDAPVSLSSTNPFVSASSPFRSDAPQSPFKSRGIELKDKPSHSRGKEDHEDEEGSSSNTAYDSL